MPAMVGAQGMELLDETRYNGGNGEADDSLFGPQPLNYKPREPSKSQLKHKKEVDRFDELESRAEKAASKDPQTTRVRKREHYENQKQDDTMHNGLSEGIGDMEAGGHPNFGVDRI